MPRTVQIREIDDDVYEALRRRAAEVGLSVPEFLRREMERIAARMSVGEWLARTRRPGVTVDSGEVLAALDEIRGPWPE